MTQISMITVHIPDQVHNDPAIEAVVRVLDHHHCKSVVVTAHRKPFLRGIGVAAVAADRHNRLTEFAVTKGKQEQAKRLFIEFLSPLSSVYYELRHYADRDWSMSEVSRYEFTALTGQPT